MEKTMRVMPGRVVDMGLGKPIKPGATFVCDELTARRLVRLGAAEEAAPAVKKSAVRKKGESA